MKLRTIATTLMLSTSLAAAGHAQSVGVGASAGAGAGTSGTSGGTVGADLGANVSANASTALNLDGNSTDAEATGFALLGTALGLDGQNAGSIEGASVVSSDGQVIGKVQGARTDPADGSAQALVAVEESLGLTVRTVAFEAASLQAESNDTLVNAMSAAELRSKVQAQVSGGAEAGTSSN